VGLNTLEMVLQDAPAGRVSVSRLLLLLAIHSGVPGIMSETRKKKLAEEG
jgi:hypothetical protein